MRVGVGWYAPLIMSVQTSFWRDEGQDASDNGSGLSEKRAALHREMRYLLTISTQTGGGGQVSPAGLAHSLGVCLIEEWNMARGSKKQAEDMKAGAMPRFVDVKLTAEQKQEFLAAKDLYSDSVRWLQDFADDGYRVGVTWSGEHQSYTLSLTCRDEKSPNNGLCMTSFAGDLVTVIALAVYKHCVVTNERWLSGVDSATESFG